MNSSVNIVFTLKFIMMILINMKNWSINVKQMIGFALTNNIYPSKKNSID